MVRKSTSTVDLNTFPDLIYGVFFFNIYTCLPNISNTLLSMFSASEKIGVMADKPFKPSVKVEFWFDATVRKALHEGTRGSLPAVTILNDVTPFNVWST